ncbi:phage regulatory protein/antirepressor Ant [Allopusillimonas ginsengisoli]|nr:phage regulatory protein/antirepressor Ant [Allopusillimonas ginsengisoli]
MSSREIADLAEARHNDVVSTIERLFNKGLLRSSRKSRIEATGGRPVEVYDLIERDVYIVIAGYSDEVRARIIDRWQQLERGALPAVPQSFADALRLAAEQADQIERQQQALQAAAPKVEFVDRYASANGSQGFRQVCKLLKANEARFRLFLLDQRIAYRLDGTLTPFQQHIDAGRFEVKTGIAHANDRAFAQMRFTPKGVNWVAGEWGKYLAAQQQEGALS